MALSKIRDESTDGSVAGGKVLQVVQTSIDSVVSASGVGENTFNDIAGMSVSITPSSSSNKILVSFTLHTSSSTTGQNNVIKLLRDSTAIVGTGGSSVNATGYFRNSDNTHILPESIQYLDAPATTSALTYKLQWASGSGTLYLNRRGFSAAYGLLSTITVMEIAG